MHVLITMNELASDTPLYLKLMQVKTSSNMKLIFNILIIFNTSSCQLINIQCLREL